MSRQYWSETVAVATAAGTAVANSMREADTHREDMLRQILEEARKTNGRVNRHDQWIAEHEMRTKFMQDSLTSVASLAGKHETALQRSRGVWIAVSTISAAIGAVAGLIVAFLK